MTISGYLQLSDGFGLHRVQTLPKVGIITLPVLCLKEKSFLPIKNSSIFLRSPTHLFTRRNHTFTCHAMLPMGQHTLKDLSVSMASLLSGESVVLKLAPAIATIAFTIWGLKPLMRWGRNMLSNRKSSDYRKSNVTYDILLAVLQPLLLWIGATYICRVLDPIVLQTEASQAVKNRLINFVKSSSTVFALAYFVSCVIQQAQKSFVASNDPNDARNMGFQFAGKAVYTAVWVAAVALFMELLGFSTQKWLTAGGLGTVLLTLAGREIFTNFLSSVMIHATRPFVVNEWVQTKIEGYELSGTVEQVGWWSPTVIRGEDQEALYIPNHKFTVNVVRNLTQKTHWRIKTHLAISHRDANKINIIVADMRKVLAKNPLIEQKKLHRRVFLDFVDPENQGLHILISCFVKTSHFEEYLCVKEGVLMDLLRVISHHRARLATPIRTMQKMYADADFDYSFGDSFYSPPVSKRPLLLIEPSYKINSDSKPKPPSNTKAKPKEPDTKEDRPPPSNKEEDSDSATKPDTEENIVLGVAISGSKRTLPIDDDVASTSPTEKTKS